MSYPSIQIYGNILSPDILNRLDTDDTLSGQKPKDFGIDSNMKVRDEISQAWSLATAYYKGYKIRLSKIAGNASGESETRNLWIGPLLSLLGYNLKYEKSAQILNSKTYHITDPADNLDGFPVIIAGHEQDPDKKPAGLRMSPHALLQEYLNYSEPFLYGMVTNGKVLRLLRDSGRIIRLSYMEVNLETMFEDSLYADFAVFYRLFHASRMPQKQNEGHESIIEQYHLDALESGTRIREKLSEAVEEAIEQFGNGFLKNPNNEDLRNAIKNKELNAENYYKLLLRLIYRLLFLLVIEERNLIYPFSGDKEIRRLRDIYFKYYSVNRLRTLTRNTYSKDPRYHDLWQGLINTFSLYESSRFGNPLGIKPLNGELFGETALGLLKWCRLDNKTMLNALEKLTWFTGVNGAMQPVNYKLLNVEEFGSVYEGLLEYDPVITETGNNLSFGFKEGTGRARSGSHYTPEELVQPLIKHSLDYVLEDREKLIKKEIEQNNYRGNEHAEKREEVIARHLLELKVADVACGSGHILLSAARRIADRYAALLEESDQPTPTGLRYAIRKVIRNCIYGVDKNPLAVELCKVALWLEAHNPGEPLNFLDHHIKCGDAIVGLAYREELEKGIPDEAFKSLPGDNKSIANNLLKQNKKERKEREDSSTAGQLKTEDSVENTLQDSVVEYKTISRMPEKNPEQIEAKRKAYKKFLDSKGYTWLKTMADTQLAQFFIPKTIENKEKIMTDNEFRTMIKGYAGRQNIKTAKAMVVAQEYAFFHWFLEFPEVFQQGGFDCILGNPPFLGGQKLTGTFGNNYLEYIKYQFEPIGAVDLVTYFFRRIFMIIKSGGFQSLIATNTIAQGKAREDGLDIITKQEGTINHAVRSMKWPGLAAVEVALVTVTKQEWKKTFVLGSKEVKIITPYLDDAETIGNPFPLKQNENKSFQGSIVLGKGFVMTPEEAQVLIDKNPENKAVLYPYLNGDDLNNNPDQSPSRWVINFKNWPLRRATEVEWENISNKEKEKIIYKIDNDGVVEIAPPDYEWDVAADYPDCLEIVEKLVKPEREKKKGDRGAKFWWQFLRMRGELYNTIAGLELVLVHTRVTKTHAYTLVFPLLVFSDATIVFAIQNYIILQSNIHEHWAWIYSSSMKGDRRYAPTECFETFPFPINISQEKETTMENIGKQYYNHRQQLVLSIQLGLTKTYNAFHSKEIKSVITNADLQDLNKSAIEKQYGKEVWNLWSHLQKTPETCSMEEAITGVIKLRELHIQMDNAVLDAYGWNDIQLKHDFYEVDYLPENDRIRFTIHPESRKEILKRLLELNHKVYEEEIKQGLHKKKDVEKFYEQNGQPVPEGIEFSDKKPKKSKSKSYKVEEPKGQYKLGL